MIHFKCHWSYCVGKWSSHIKRGFSSFSLSYIETSGYCHYHVQFLNFYGHCYCQFDLYKFDVMCFNNDNTCSNNNSCHSRQDMILHRANARRWFHSPCHPGAQSKPLASVYFFIPENRLWSSQMKSLHLVGIHKLCIIKDEFLQDSFVTY